MVWLETRFQVPLEKRVTSVVALICSGAGAPPVPLPELKVAVLVAWPSPMTRGPLMP